MADSIPITQSGYEKLKEELKRLKTIDRPTVISEIAEARKHGDLSENAEYHSAREKQSFIEGRILELEDKTSRLQVVQEGEGTPPSVIFGTYATIKDVSEDSKGEQKTYRIVGDIEADITVNFLSTSSPIGRSLLNKKKGEIVVVSLPRGEKEYEIVKISYKP